MRTRRSASDSLFVPAAVGLVAAVALLVPFADPSGARAGRALEISVDGGQTVVAATGCNWPEGEAYGPGSSVDVTVTAWFAGGGQDGAPTTIGSSRIVPPSGGGWEYAVPRAPLAEVPAWAEELVVRAEAHCQQAIGPGFDYGAATSRRAIVRPAAPPTTTTHPQGATRPPTPATAVVATVTFTG